MSYEMEEELQKLKEQNAEAKKKRIQRLVRRRKLKRELLFDQAEEIDQKLSSLEKENDHITVQETKQNGKKTDKRMLIPVSLVDYNQQFVDTGDRPQNWILQRAEPTKQYPVLWDLIREKEKLVDDKVSPPMSAKINIKEPGTLKATLGPAKFDVILIDAPWIDSTKDDRLTFDQMRQSLDVIPDLLAGQSFVFLWCGSGEGIELGRILFHQWNLRRVEDICWTKTNSKKTSNSLFNQPPDSIFVRTKEHCLVGMKGTARREHDSIIHTNIDVDVIVSEDDDKIPEQIFSTIERLCLGGRRLHLYGEDEDVCAGWVTVGPQITQTSFDLQKYQNFFKNAGSYFVGSNKVIDNLRTHQ